MKKNNSSINLSNLNFLYYLANGSPGLALKIYSEDFNKIYNMIVKIFIEKEPLSIDVINLADKISTYSNEEFRNFIILLRFIALSFIKINLGYFFDSLISSSLLEYLINVAKSVPNFTTMKILEFLDENEKDLFIYNLDKKIFCFNIFSSLKEYE